MKKDDLVIYGKATAMSLYMLVEHNLGKTKYGSAFGVVGALFNYAVDLLRNKKKGEPKS